MQTQSTRELDAARPLLSASRSPALLVTLCVVAEAPVPNLVEIALGRVSGTTTAARFDVLEE